MISYITNHALPAYLHDIRYIDSNDSKHSKASVSLTSPLDSSDGR